MLHICFFHRWYVVVPKIKMFLVGKKSLLIGINKPLNLNKTKNKTPHVDNHCFYVSVLMWNYYCHITVVTIDGDVIGDTTSKNHSDIEHDNSFKR